MEFHFRKSRIGAKSRFKESKCGDRGHSLNRDFTVLQKVCSHVNDNASLKTKSTSFSLVNRYLSIDASFLITTVLSTVNTNVNDNAIKLLTVYNIVHSKHLYVVLLQSLS